MSLQPTVCKGILPFLSVCLSFCLKKEKKVWLLSTLFSLITCPLPWLRLPERFLLPGFSLQLTFPGVAQRLQREWQEYTEDGSRSSKAAVGGGKLSISHIQRKMFCHDRGQRALGHGEKLLCMRLGLQLKGAEGGMMLIQITGWKDHPLAPFRVGSKR